MYLDAVRRTPYPPRLQKTRRRAAPASAQPKNPEKARVRIGTEAVPVKCRFPVGFPVAEKAALQQRQGRFFAFFLSDGMWL
jgi:hypothetical protein